MRRNNLPIFTYFFTIESSMCQLSNWGLVVFEYTCFYGIMSSPAGLIPHSSQKKKSSLSFEEKRHHLLVGRIMPSVPNIVIDPNLARGRMILSRLSYGSDIICALLLTATTTLFLRIGRPSLTHVDRRVEGFASL